MNRYSLEPLFRNIGNYTVIKHVLELVHTILQPTQLARPLTSVIFLA